MDAIPETQLSFPELQLRERGTQGSFDILSTAADGLTDAELETLEDELIFYTRTGLVGIHMSRLLVLLQLDAAAKSAQRKCLALVATRDVSSKALQAAQAAA